MRPCRFLSACILALGALAATAAFAGTGELSLGATGGALGFGPELGWRFNDYLGVRGNVGFLTFAHEEQVNDIDYDGDLDLLSAGGMLDWYPFRNGLRASIGARWNGNQIGLDARPTSPVTIGDTTYTPAQIGQLEGKIEANPIAPTLSVGYGGKLWPGLTLGVDLGVMYQGAPRVKNMRATGGLLEFDPIFQADVEAEADRIEDKVDGVQLWPVAQLMLLYRF